jgi:hypothetical protein
MSYGHRAGLYRLITESVTITTRSIHCRRTDKPTMTVPAVVLLAICSCPALVDAAVGP